MREMAKIALHYNRGLELIEEIQAELESLKNELRTAAYNDDLNKVIGIEAWLGMHKDEVIDEIKGKYKNINVATVNGCTYRV